MYLESVEQTRDEAPSTRAMLTEQVPKLTEAADLSGPSPGSAALDMKVLVEYTDQTVDCGDMKTLCLEHRGSRDFPDEPCAYFNGHPDNFEQYSASDAFLESDESLDDECETLGLSQPFDECARHCECFKACESSGHCANHSLACACCPPCEHCAEHLQLFQQRSLAEPFGFEAGKSEGNCDSFGQFEMSDFTPELLQHYQPSALQYESFDSEPSTEDSEKCDITSDSVDLSDCEAELCEYSQIECEDENYPAEGNQDETEARDEESCIKSEDVTGLRFGSPVKVCFDDSEHVSFASECCEKHMRDTSKFDALTYHSEYETTQQHAAPEETNSDATVFFEDGSSDCSSVETKSFKTCLDGSIPSDTCSDSSTESEKEAEEDSSDEQTPWESFEEDEDIEESDVNESVTEEKESPTVDVAMDFYDFFDRDDNHRHAFALRQHYISCFDGGDMHDHLYVHQHPKNKCKESEEPNLRETCFDALEEAGEDDGDANLRAESAERPKNWKEDSDSSLAEDEFGENEFTYSDTDFYGENYAKCEYGEDEDTCEGEEVFAKESEGSLSAGEEDSMCAPFAEDISVGGDAYEDRISEIPKCPAENTSMTVIHDKEPDEEQPVYTYDEFSACSEREPYWSLTDNEIFDLGAEEYFAYQIKSIQTSTKQTLNGFIIAGRPDDEKIQEKAPGDPSRNEGEDEGETVELVDLSEGLLAAAQAEESHDDLNEISIAPSDIIHSVASEQAEAEGKDALVQGRKAEVTDEEDSEEESNEPCECEYCISPIEQEPAKPLLPQLESNDAGKICVVIDLDETLVHSSFKPVNNADFILPVEIDGTVHQVYVLKRPHVDEFLRRMGEMFECVLFTASLSKYADPVSDVLDKGGAFRSRLFREACVFHKGNYVKDLSRLGRDLNKVIIIDNSPASYIFHPENAVPVVSWFDDTSDSELLDLIPFFERLSKADDVYELVKQQTSPSEQT